MSKAELSLEAQATEAANALDRLAATVRDKRLNQLLQKASANEHERELLRADPSGYLARNGVELPHGIHGSAPAQPDGLIIICADFGPWRLCLDYDKNGVSIHAFPL